MNKLLLAVLLMSSSIAFAGGKPEVTPSNNAVAGAGAISGSNSSSTALNLNSNSASSGSFSSITNLSENNVTNDAPEIPVSSAYAPSVWATSECMGASSGGASGMNIGLSFGTTWKDKDCSLFKAAKEFENAGYKEDAMRIRCKSDLVSDTHICKALKE